MRAYIRGHLATLEHTYQPAPPEPPPPGSRRAITAFTPASRRNLIRKVASLRRGLTGVWLTLTYDDLHYPYTYAQAKRQLHTFFVQLTRRYPTLAAIWKMEHGPRTGRLHFHIILTADPLPWLDYDFIRAIWPYGMMWIEFIRQGTLATYVGKYTTKPSAAPGGEVYLDLDAKSETAPPLLDLPGRWWGIRGRSNFLALLDIIRNLDPLALLNHSYFAQYRARLRAWLGFLPPKMSVVLYYPPPVT